MENLCFLDFESTSKTDLSVHGLGRYLVDPTTRPYCFTFRLPGMSSADLWTEKQPLPFQVLRALESHYFVAHNAPFDFHMWNECLRRRFPEALQLKVEQVRCTAARARYNGLPGGLALACEAMDLPIQKDMEGGAYMKQLMFLGDALDLDDPNPDIQYALTRCFQYALTDTDAMYGLWCATKPLPAMEQRFFELDMRVNARGVGVDVEAAQAMVELQEYAQGMIDYEITLATDGKILAATEVAKIKDYFKDFGQEIDDAGREALKKLAEKEGLDPKIAEVVALRLDASRAPKKPHGILRAHVGGRLQHHTVYHGALSGRSTARGAGGTQTLNTARPRPGFKIKQCEAIVEAALARDVAFLSSDAVGPILAALADAQRQLFCATEPNCVLVGADLSGIEARFAPWLADDEPALEAIDNKVDAYKIAAMQIYDILYEAVNSDQRQIGKVSELSLTFGGGDGALVSMAGNLGVYIDPALVSEIVFKWRAGKPRRERWWSMLEYAVLIALDQPGREVDVPVGRGGCSKVTFVRDERALRMRMPCGWREISYHNARLHLEPGASVPVAIYDKPEGYIETLDRKILSNNLTQGSARDLFWSAMLDMEHELSPIVHHVYDEVVLEVNEQLAKLRLEQLIARLTRGEAWCPGLKLGAEGWIGKRWGKY